MPNAFLSLACNLKDKAIRQNLTERLMKLFQQLGKDITTPEDRVRSTHKFFFLFMKTLSSPLIQGMGYLLPVLAELMQDHSDNDIKNPDPMSDITKLCRSVWFYCVLFRFVEREAWRSDW